MDIKLVQHAKDYIDAMARGVHPLTGQEIPEEDTLNNIKISRCLYYVSDVLGEVIENGGVSKPQKGKKEPFDETKIELSKFPYSSSPKNVSDLAAQINALRPENMVKLKVTAITDWLVDIGMLEVLIFNDKKRKVPTEKGLAMGIVKEERTGLYGTYQAVLYDENAQHFILDNLSAIIQGGFNGKRERVKQENSEDVLEI